MDILNALKKTSKFNQLYDVPFQLTGIQTKDLKIALFCNPCFGFGDIIFCLKMYHYIKDWYGIECTVFTTKPKAFIENGVKDVMAVKIPRKSYEECANIKGMKVYSVNEKGLPHKRVNLKTKYDLIFVAPWIGTDFEPKHSAMKQFFPYSNRFNTFLFSEYNAPEPHKYDFPTGIGKGLYGLLITDWKITHERMVDNPYLMVHLTKDDRVNVTRCFSKFMKLMMEKYSKTNPNLDVILPDMVLNENPKNINKLIKYITDNKYYDVVDIITKTTCNPPVHSSSKRVLRFRTELTPMPYDKYVSLFNYCLPDVLITGDQSVTDIISCCQNYTIYYQIMPWKKNLAKNLSKVTGAQNNYLAKVRDSCGLQKMSESKKLNLHKIEELYDFRKLGKQKLDGIIANARKLSTDKDVKAFVNIVLNSKKKSTVVSKFKKYLDI